MLGEGGPLQTAPAGSLRFCPEGKLSEAFIPLT